MLSSVSPLSHIRNIFLLRRDPAKKKKMRAECICKGYQSSKMGIQGFKRKIIWSTEVFAVFYILWPWSLLPTLSAFKAPHLYSLNPFMNQTTLDCDKALKNFSLTLFQASVLTSTKIIRQHVPHKVNEEMLNTISCFLELLVFECLPCASRCSKHFVLIIRNLTK